MSTVIFEDDTWQNFLPFSSMRHLAQQVLGSASVVERLSATARDPISLSGRRYLAGTVKGETGLAFNETVDGAVLAINARVNPHSNLRRLVGGRTGFALLDRGEVAMAVLGKTQFQRASSPDGTMPQRRLLALAKGLERLETSRQ